MHGVGQHPKSGDRSLVLAIEAIEDEARYYGALDDFWRQNQDSFVTDYAATNPGEDLAETFTVFVLSPRPTGDRIADLNQALAQI